MTEPGAGPLLEWVERVVAYLTPEIPPVAGRVLGWLMVCDPPEQSAGEIADAIGASRASLTTSLRLLIDAGFVSRIRKPGVRTVFYRVDDSAWARVVQRQIDALASFRDITTDGMALVGPDAGRASRLRAAHDVFTWMAEVFAQAPRPPHPDSEEQS
ncbi:DNA-binding transcriptional ArsR family regulator [Nocardia transvalensis]|uniref:DNA-binding transcriptional ArsR family regulator n=1 Tax=Nocardia transvalensis TaxID=37333 RepID=A0A7W9UKR1_9NOCA|nr:MarR family transcriptional regulator [Nocardia transvalensis]MBB5916759.1 DNA-binding transcriptional ArsR family regulator [Nocardia transvalensis]